LKTRIAAGLPTWLAVLGLALMSCSASAIDLGTLHLKAAADQTPYVEVELRSKARLDASALRVSLASREAYAAAGLTYHPGLALLRISVQPRPDGQAMVKLDQLPRDAKSLDLLIVVSDHLTPALAEYRLDLQRGPQDLLPSPAGTLQFKVRPASSDKTLAPPTPTAIDQDASAVREAILARALAWSQRNVDAYVAAYSADYPGNQAKMTRQAWLDQRRTLILARKHISVELSDIHLKRQGDRFIASFTQHYRSDGPNDQSRKRLVFALENGHWLIQRETTWQ
jgi:hypothetical protein